MTLPRKPATPAAQALQPTVSDEPSVTIPNGLDTRSEMYVLLGALAGRVDFASRLLQLVALREKELQREGE